MMVTLAKREDEQEIKTLWKKIFQDDDEFLTPFFTYRFNEKSCYIIKKDSHIISFLFANECNVVYRSKQKEKGLNITGVLTIPEERGKGLMSKLLSKVKEDYPSTPLILYPEEYIRGGYEKQGFQASLQGITLSFECKTINSFYNIDRLKSLYNEAINKFGGVERDDYAWYEILKDSIIIQNDNNYVIYSEDFLSHEAYLNDDSLFPFLTNTVSALPTNFVRTLGKELKPFGMGYNLKDEIFIPEQY